MSHIHFWLDQPYKRSPDKEENKVIQEKLKQLRKNRKAIPATLFNEKQTAIYLHFIIKGQNRIKVKTEFKVYPKQWDFDRGLPKRVKGIAPIIENALEALRSKVIGKYTDICRETEELSSTTLKKAITTIVKCYEKDSFNPNNFFEVFDTFVKRQPYASRTTQKYASFKKLLKDFENDAEYKLAFDRINNEFDAKFRSYLCDEKEYLNSTIDKSYTNLRTFFKWAIQEKYTKNDYYKNFKYKNDTNEIITLDIDEFKSIVDYKPEHSRHIKVKNLFLFQCLTAQRVQDLLKLKREDIIEKKQKDGSPSFYWKLYQHKGNKTVAVEIPLHKVAVQILDYYKNEQTPLPRLSNDKYNEYLKELCKLAGLTKIEKIVKYSGNKIKEVTVPKYELISTKVARKSAINILSRLGVPAEVIMAITGHKDYKVIAQHYRKVSFSEAEKAIAQIDV